MVAIARQRYFGSAGPNYGARMRGYQSKEAEKKIGMERTNIESSSNNKMVVIAVVQVVIVVHCDDVVVFIVFSSSVRKEIK